MSSWHRIKDDDLPPLRLFVAVVCQDETGTFVDADIAERDDRGHWRRLDGKLVERSETHWAYLPD